MAHHISQLESELQNIPEAAPKASPSCSVSEKLARDGSSALSGVEHLTLLCVVGIRKKANMITPTTTPEYLLLFRGMDWDRGLSPEEIQNVMSRWIAWFDRLTEQGKARAGQPLTDKGKVISGKKGQTVLDGPFAESKETVAGYILLQVDSLDEAVEIGKECPGLDYGLSVEVRLVDHLRASLFSINMVRK